MNVIAPIRKHVVVRATPDRAFEVFTAGMTGWWNPQYSIGTEPMAAVVVEPREGGRWYERGDGGAECDWGRVLVWDPPWRVVFSWQITADWRWDPALHTELDVHFTSGEAGTTRVDLEHRGLESYGSAAEGLKAVFDGPGGWIGLLERFADRQGHATGRERA